MSFSTLRHKIIAATSTRRPAFVAGMMCAVLGSAQSAPQSQSPQPMLGTVGTNHTSLPLRLPASAPRRSGNDPTVIALQRQLARYPTSAGWRRLAERFLQLGQFQEAAKAYRSEAAIYRKKGLIDAAFLQERTAARYETTVRVDVERQLNDNETKSLYTGARLEPRVGTYVGAFIDLDDQLRQTVRGDQGRTHRRPEEFARRVGKPHASYFTYVRYGQSLPRRWLEMCKREKVIPHIAWEPTSLDTVRDDAYLRAWAKALREYDWPVFIRFAGEMNGKWTPYHGNPALYRAKFRLVHRVLRQQSPKVATIWCVNSVPSTNISQYYPGDDGCDWVGINLYSVPFYDNNRNRSALLDSPLPLLEPVYRLYSSRKPIAICEYGASHMAAWDRVRRNDFAINQMAQLYGALPRLYPRIKMINWFSSNNIRYARPGRQLNNYNLIEQAPILNAYRTLIAAPYFLGNIEVADIPTLQNRSTPEAKTNSSQEVIVPSLPRPLSPGQKLAIPSRLSIWIKTYVPRPSVYLAIDGRVVYAAKQVTPHIINLSEQQARQWNLVKPSSGTRQLKVYVYDDNRRLLHSRTIPLAG